MACRDSALLKKLHIPQRKGAVNPQREVAGDEINKPRSLGTSKKPLLLIAELLAQASERAALRLANSDGRHVQ